VGHYEIKHIIATVQPASINISKETDIVNCFALPQNDTLAFGAQFQTQILPTLCLSSIVEVKCKPSLLIGPAQRCTVYKCCYAFQKFLKLVADVDSEQGALCLAIVHSGYEYRPKRIIIQPSILLN